MMSKTCPICRAKRACNETMQLRGLTELLDSVQKYFLVNERNKDDVERSVNNTVSSGSQENPEIVD